MTIVRSDGFCSTCCYPSLSLRKTSSLNASAKGKKPSQPRTKKELPAELNELQEKLQRRMGMKSTLTGGINKGKIVLQYSTREELEHLNDLLDRMEEN